jgi:hypothetical protein
MHRNIIGLLLVLMASVQVHAASAVWDLNDVSYLLPLPKTIGKDLHLTLDAPARGGSLLPSTIIQKMPLLALHQSKEQSIASLRVLAVRIDPCFPLPTPQACQRQMRLVWQPFETFKGNIRSVDAALHSFYILSDDEFSSLLQDINAWKNKYPVNTSGLPLQVHPAWGVDGDQSPSLVEFQNIVTKYAGAQNLSRMTLMVLRGGGDMWTFAGFDFADGAMNQITIPRLNRPSQAFVNFAIPTDHFQNAQIAPAIRSGGPMISTLIRNSDEIMTGNDQALKTEMQVLAQFENPHSFNPENLDCVSCHITQQVRNWAVKARADIQLAEVYSSIRYQNYKYNLSNITEHQLNTRDIRAFGYFNRDASISQRVINESAATADAVNLWINQ